MWQIRCLLFLVIGGLQLEVQICVASSWTQTAEGQYLEKRDTRLQTGNTGNEFYIGFMDNYIKPLFNLDFLIVNRTRVFITTTDPSGAVVIIESEQGTSMHNLSPGVTLAKTLMGFKVKSGSDRNMGVKIKAEESKQISVFALNEELHSVDGFTALPCSRLPSVSLYEYYAVSVPPSTTSQNSVDSAFLIVACSDNTTLTITPTQDVDHPYISNIRVRSGATITITLQERETLYIQSPNDLTGSKVVSTTPISFFTGHECGNVPANVGECDHLVEQIPPTVTWGTQFILAPTATRTANDIIKVVSSEDNTTGTISCTNTESDAHVDTFNVTQAGNFIAYNLSYDTYCFVESDKPVLLVQFTPGKGADGGENADPFMVIVPAINQYLENITFSTVNGLGLYFSNYINIFIPSGPLNFNPSKILLDGTPVATENWVTIPCSDNHICGHAVTTNISEGTHSIWYSDYETPIGLTIYGLSLLETYAYVGGLKLSLPGLDPDQTPISHFVLSGKSLCIPCASGSENLRNRAAVDWSRGDESLLHETPRLRIETDGSLCINNVTLDDEGNYTCYMLGDPYLHNLSVIGGIIIEPPSCASPDKGALVGIGQDTAYLDSSISVLQVCCRVQGPPAVVTWLVDGTHISKETGGYEFEAGFIRYSGSLTLGCVTYTCQANFSSPMLLAVESSEICVGINSPPSVVNIIGETSVLEHSSVLYQCLADGFPAPTILWTADRDSEDSLPSSATDYGNGTLAIDGVTERDGKRKFCCDVGNEHGQHYDCISLDVLIPPELIKDVVSPMLIVSIPFGATVPLDITKNITISIGQTIMIPETYNLIIECKIHRANPKPSILWSHDNETIQNPHPHYTVQSDGTLVIKNIVRGSDDGIYTCIADTPNIGQDESSSLVLVTVPPKINQSDVANSPGNCLDLTQSLENSHRIGIDICVRAGAGAELTLECAILQGVPTPDIKWLKDGKELVSATSYTNTSKHLTLSLPTNASRAAKLSIEGNYSCVAINKAGIVSASSYVLLFGDIPVASATSEFVRKQSEVYHQLHRTLTEHFPGVQDGNEYLTFLTTGKVLSYDDFNPGYLYDESEESVLPQTMENMFDLVDVIPDGGSIVFNPYRAPRLQNTYSELVEMLQVAPSSLNVTEQQEIRTYLLQTVNDLGSLSSIPMPRLSLYLLYKNFYYMTVLEIDDTIESQRQKRFDWEFPQWYERNMKILDNKKEEALTRWKMFADKDEVEERLDALELTDYSQDINTARAVLLTNRRESRFKDEKVYYLVKLYPDTWYRVLKNRVTESIHQMQFQLAQLKTEIQILEITSQYLEKESKKQKALNELFPSLDPVYQLYCDLDVATYLLEELVKESEDMRYECIVSGNPADCHLYWGLRDHIRDEVLANYTEFYWYVHTVQAALNHRDYSIPAISSTINDIQIKVTHTQASINIALSDLAERKDEADNDWDFDSQFVFRPHSSFSDYNFELPSSLNGRLLWYINPESTALVPKDVFREYNLTINHLNIAFTNVSVKFMSVNIHRRWFKSALFSNKHLILKNPDVMVSPGALHPPEFFRETIKNGTYSLPLYPSSLLLATDIELTVDVPFIYHTLPTLIKLSYDPHITGGFGPFSFGPLHRARAGNMKFRVGIRDSKITITLPGAQLIGYVCDVVPQHPKEAVYQRHRTRRSVTNYHSKDSAFEQWLFSKMNGFSTHEDLFLKESRDHNAPQNSFPSSVGGDTTSYLKHSEDVTKHLEMLITPTHPLDEVQTNSVMLPQYNISTNTSSMYGH